MAFSSASPSFLGLLRETDVPTDFVLEAANGAQFPCFKLLLSGRSRPLAAMMNWKEGRDGKLLMDEEEKTVKVIYLKSIHDILRNVY